MRNLHQLKDSVLIDMLAEYTLKFTHLFRIGKGIYPTKQYSACKKSIEQIIGELNERGLIPGHGSPESEAGREAPTSNAP